MFQPVKFFLILLLIIIAILMFYIFNNNYKNGGGAVNWLVTFTEQYRKFVKLQCSDDYENAVYIKDYIEDENGKLVRNNIMYGNFVTPYYQIFNSNNVTHNPILIPQLLCVYLGPTKPPVLFLSKIFNKENAKKYGMV